MSLLQFYRFSTLLVIYYLATTALFCQSDHYIYVLGNLADIHEEYPKFKNALEKELGERKENYSLLLLGDFFPKGFDDPDKLFHLSKVELLMDLVGQDGRASMYIMSGDRDWNDSGKGGLSSVLDIEDHLTNYAREQNYLNVQWITPKACPGPFVYKINPYIQLIALNSQWWNHPFDKLRPSDAICDIIHRADIKEELLDILDESQNINTMIVSHHPIETHGNAGGRFSLLDHLKPFPVIGSFINYHRANIGTTRDMSNPLIAIYVKMMEDALYEHSNIIYTSAHDRNQQLIERDHNALINSGGMTKGSYVAADYHTTFKQKNPGIARIHYYTNGQVDYDFLKWDDEGGLDATFHHILFTTACPLEGEVIPERMNEVYTPCRTPVTDIIGTKDLHEKIEVTASDNYASGKFKKWLLGNHYRDSWSTPVQTSYLDLNHLYGGLSVQKKGGGRQTISLKFKTHRGDPYTFRSVDKDPAKALDYTLRSSIIRKVFQDQTSSQMPYGALVVSDLVDKINVLHPSPQLFVLPSVPELGLFQEKYGNLFGMLEEDPGKANYEGEYFEHADDIVKSNKLFNRRYKSSEHRVDEEELLRARLFDILIGDWSRHEDNWKWASFKDSTGVRNYRPIPRDRDHAFSRWDGFLPSIADLPFGLPNTENFGYRIRKKGFRSLVYQARYMDRFLLTQVTKADYLQQAAFIQNQITTEDIGSAVRKLPPPTYKIDGQEITEKLLQRKKDLPAYASQYYNWLNREVEVVGTKEKEYFRVEKMEDGKVHVQVSKRTKKNNLKTWYDRTFTPDETKELRLYGLNDDDVFEIIGDYPSDTRIRLIGGSGDDTFVSTNITSGRKYEVYDKGKGTKIENQDVFKRVDHWNNQLYEYDRNSLGFNTYVPYLFFSYSGFNGFQTSGGASFTNRKWGKQNFASKHSLRGALTTQGDASFIYGGKWHHVVRKWDLDANVQLANPKFLNRFYGIGNNTVIDPTLKANDFYLAEYNKYHISLGLSRTFWEKSSLGFSFGYEINSSKRIEGSILDVNPGQVFGANQVLNVLPLDLNLDINFMDNAVFPYRGIRGVLQYHNGSFVGDYSGNFGIINGTIEYFASTNNNKPLTLGLKIAGSKDYGTIPFYKQQTLGGSSGLRGYASHRFTGSSILYFNSELRWQFAETTKTFLPLRFGIMGFYDVGRVYSPQDDAVASGFHHGYGAGFYMVPYLESFTLSVYFSFSEEQSLYPLIGIGTRLK